MTSERRNYDVEMAEIKSDIKYIKKSLDENKEQHGELKDMFEKWMAESEKRFSGKWVERVVIWGGSSIGLIIIGYTIKSIFHIQ